VKKPKGGEKTKGRGQKTGYRPKVGEPGCPIQFPVNTGGWVRGCKKKEITPYALFSQGPARASSEEHPNKRVKKPKGHQRKDEDYLKRPNISPESL